jgi:hypothetical protein
LAFEDRVVGVAVALKFDSSRKAAKAGADDYN